MYVIKFIIYDSCKQILNSLHTIEVNLRSTTPNRQSIVIVHRPYICWEVRQMGEFFLNDETYENNNRFLHIILEYDRPNLDRFLPRGPNIWLVWQEIVYRKLQRLWNHLKFNNYNCHLLPITMALDFFLLIHSSFILYQLDMLSIQNCNQHSNSSFGVAGVWIIASSAYIFSTLCCSAKLRDIIDE